MTDNEMPADWAIEKAWGLRRFGVGISLADIKATPHVFETLIAFARYIEAHEKPPISRELLCAREAVARKWASAHAEIESGDWDGCDLMKTALSAIQLYASDFGETDG